VNVALAEVTLAPAAVVMNHIETLPWWLSSGMFVTEVPSLNDADIVAPDWVCVRLNCQIWVPPGAGGGPSNCPQVPSAFVPWPVNWMVSAAAGCTTTSNHAVVTASTMRVLPAKRPRRVR
jgi:hypothetical protein